MIENRAVSRAIAVGIPVLVLALFWTVLVMPVHNAFRTADQDIEVRRHLLGKLSEVLTRVGYSHEKASDVVTKLDRSELLDAAPDAVIAANLQSRIAELARQQGLQTQTMQALPARTDLNVKWIGLGVALSGTPESIAKLLALIEEGKPYLFLERLSLNVQGTPLSEDGPAPALTADFEVYGAVLRERTQ